MNIWSQVINDSFFFKGLKRFKKGFVKSVELCDKLYIHIWLDIACSILVQLLTSFFSISQRPCGASI